MDFFRRSFLSIKCRKKNSLIIWLLFFVVFVFVFSGFAIQSATEKSSAEARKKLGGDVDLVIDSEQAEDIDRSELSIPLQLIEQLAKLDSVKDYQLFVDGSAKKSEDLAFIESEKPENMQAAAIEGENSGTDTPVFLVNGVLNSQNLSAFKEKQEILIEGKPLSTSEKEPVALLEQELAQKNNLSVGDQFTLPNDAGNSVEFKIKGIYQNKGKVDQRMKLFDILQPGNKIYTNYQTAQQFSDGLAISKANFELTDPEKSQEFRQQAQEIIEKKNTKARYQLDTHDEMYQKMIGPIEQVASFIRLIVNVSLLAGAAILILLIGLSIKDRKTEIGILMSLGEEKIKIIAQLFCEMLLLATAAFFIAGAIAEPVGQTISDRLISQQIEEKNVSAKESSTTMVSNQGAEETAPVKKVNVTIDTRTYLFVGVSGLLLTVIATGLSAVLIVRLQPREIFAKKE